MIDALRRFAGSLRRVRASARSALESVLRCRTAALGGHEYECDCGYTVVVYNSCGNRHCPQCQGSRRHRWLEAQQRLLLPVAHFQVVFTLPAELRPIARQFPKEVYDLLFRAADHALKRLAATRWAGAMPAILAVLHTWSRDLSFHPHVHCVVSAGGLTDDDGWVSSPPDYLFPTRALQAVFRGYFLAKLRRLDLPLDLDQRIALRNARRKAARKGWVVHVERPEGRDPVLMLKYLARYVYQTAISDHRMVEITADTVTFRTRDTTCTLPGAEFVRRFAQHVLPKGFRKVRHSGLLAPGHRPRLAVARDLIEHLPACAPSGDPVLAATSAPVATVVPTQRNCCPQCGARLRVHVVRPQALPPARGPP